MDGSFHLAVNRQWFAQHVEGAAHPTFHNASREARRGNFPAVRKWVWADMAIRAALSMALPAVCAYGYQGAWSVTEATRAGYGHHPCWKAVTHIMTIAAAPILTLATTLAMGAGVYGCRLEICGAGGELRLRLFGGRGGAISLARPSIAKQFAHSLLSVHCGQASKNPSNVPGSVSVTVLRFLNSISTCNCRLSLLSNNTCWGVGSAIACRT